jgi:cell division protein FtsL
VSRASTPSFNRQQLRSVVRAAAGFALLAGLLILQAAGRIWVLEQGYELSRLRTEEQTLGQQNGRLSLELNTLRAPARLERLAHGKLFMSTPGTGDMLLEGGPAGLPERALAEIR